MELLSGLLRDEPAPIPADDVGGWWRRFRGRRPDLRVPIDRAILGGFHADRVGFAFAGGYEAALRALVPALEPETIASFCATEEGGNHPRAMESRLTRRPGGGFALSGAKRWSTMGPLAGVLLVVASEGDDAAGRRRLRLVVVDRAAPGVRMASMPAPVFMPEVPHGAIELEAVAIEPAALLPGDGYARYVKPFRTVEDLHVHGAVLGYVLSVARRHDFPRPAIEGLLASIVAVRALAALDPAAGEGHVALAGLLARDASLLDDLEPHWTCVEDAERARWRRDRAFFGSVAGTLRERRRQRAWETLASGFRTAPASGSGT